MKTLYLECGMGAAGDMLTAALLELLPDPDAFLAKLNALGIPGVHTERVQTVHCGITGTGMRVTVNGEEEISEDVPEHPHHHGHEEEGHHHHDHDGEHHHHHDHEEEHSHHHDHDGEHHHHHDHEEEEHPHHHDHEEEGHHHHDGEHHHHHASVRDIGAVIDALGVSERVKQDAKAVYALIAEAESHAHGRPAEEIHFHEVGTMDAVADVVAVCMLMEEIGADRVTASPVSLGGGFVRCMHGVLPVPAPATAYILQGVPTRGGPVEAELCTPTGAALLKHFVSSFGKRPEMTVEKIGNGMGRKEFAFANCVRAFLGEAEEGEVQHLTLLETNLDDMTGEAVGFAMETLFAAGAFEVFTQPINMKKSRPGILLRCICAPEDADRMAHLVLKHTTTLGVRRVDCTRYALDREIREAQTRLGTVRVKEAGSGELKKSKPEYEDLARIAREKGMSIEEVRKEILPEL